MVSARRINEATGSESIGRPAARRGITFVAGVAQIVDRVPKCRSPDVVAVIRRRPASTRTDVHLTPEFGASSPAPHADDTSSVIGDQALTVSRQATAMFVGEHRSASQERTKCGSSSRQWMKQHRRSRMESRLFSEVNIALRAPGRADGAAVVSRASQLGRGLARAC